MQNLKPCPCGKTPDSLHIADNGSKWAYVSGNCCNGWHIEFRTQYHRIESDECAALAVEAWNLAERSSLLTQRPADEATGCAHRAPRPVGEGLLLCDDCGETLRR